jgi:ribosomal protein L40E
MSQRTVGYIRLEWTCPNCSTRNPGPQKTCSNCGAPQPENVKFERPLEEQLVTGEEEIRRAQAGADIHCGFCGARNPGDAVTCSQCGGDLKEGRARQAGQILAAAGGPKEITCDKCGTVNPASKVTCGKCGAPLPRPVSPAVPVTPAAPAAAAVSPVPGQPAGKSMKTGLFLGIGAAVLACCAAVAFALFTLPVSSAQGTVEAVYWKTVVPVQEQQEVRHTDETGSVPSDAYDVSCHDESTQVCEQKTIDKGNGYAEQVEECHDETEKYCSYTVLEWKTVSEVTREGDDLNPIYADPSLASGQRQGSPTTELVVYFSTDKGRKEYKPSTVVEFQQFLSGSSWTLKLNLLGGVVSVGP